MLPTVATFDTFSGKFLSAEKLASKPPLGGVEAAFNSVAPISGATKAWEDAKLKGKLQTRYRTLPVLDRTAIGSGATFLSLNQIDMFASPVYVGEAPTRSLFVALWNIVIAKQIKNIFIVSEETELDPLTGTARRMFDFFYPPNIKDKKKINYDNSAARIDLACLRKCKSVDGVTWLVGVSRGGCELGEVHITQIRCWPVGGAPTSMATVYEAVNFFRSARDPQLVLCDTGCGRSGSFVLAAVMLDKLDKGLDIHPTALLADVRKCRAYAVQNAVQFAYCQLLLAHHAKLTGAASTQDAIRACAMLEEQFEKMRAAHTRIIEGGGGAADGEDDSAREAEAGGGEEGEGEGDANEEWVHAGYPHIPRPLGELTVEPDVLDFSLHHAYHIKITNAGDSRIGWAIKTTNEKRLGVDPPCGVLDPKEAVLMAVSCDAIKHGEEDPSNDRLTIEWTNTPDGAGKTFRREWFQGDGMVRRKNLPTEYNP